MNLEPEAWSLRWYRQMVGISSIGDTTVVTDKWMLGTRNSFFVGIVATLLATALGTVAALGLSRPHMPFKAVLMAILISPMIVPLIITAAGMFFFYLKWINSYLSRINSCTYCSWNAVCCNYSYSYFNWF